MKGFHQLVEHRYFIFPLINRRVLEEMSRQKETKNKDNHSVNAFALLSQKTIFREKKIDLPL